MTMTLDWSNCEEAMNKALKFSAKLAEPDEFLNRISGLWLTWEALLGVYTPEKGSELEQLCSAAHTALKSLGSGAFRIIRPNGGSDAIMTLQSKIEHLAEWGSDSDQWDLLTRFYEDSGVPYSFVWTRLRRIKGSTNEWERDGNGGLVYHGPHDGYGDGGAPTFSVCVGTPKIGWSIHT